jgi:hypothetical protein
MSAIPEFQQRQIERWCERRVPGHLRDEVRVECRRRGGAVTILERRAPWSEELGTEWSESRIAQLRYGDDGHWSVYWSDSNGRWLPHAMPRAKTPVPLLEEIDRNPGGVFWG